MILVDSSVWMDYFKGGEKSFYLEILLRRNLIQINDVVLAEITPPLILRKQNTLVEILDSIKSKPLEVYWPGIIDLQILNLKNGINKIGIPDLIWFNIAWSTTSNYGVLINILNLWPELLN